MARRHGLWCCRRCGFHWYWSVGDQTVKLDRKCPKDGHRIQATLDRRPGNRGRPRTDPILEYPTYRPPATIRKEAKARNRKRMGVRREEDRRIGFQHLRFVKSSRVMHKIEELRTKSAPTGLEDEE